MTVLVIDNYDSFVYNLVQYLGELKVECESRTPSWPATSSRPISSLRTTSHSTFNSPRYCTRL